MWQTNHPLEGEVFFEDVLGDEKLEMLRARALAFEKPDLEGIIAWLKHALPMLERLASG
jgi:hypothetical protein